MRPINKIAQEIRSTWNPVNYAAEPYLNAMMTLSTCEDAYGCDSLRSMVLYFLCNASTFRGADARRLKAELKEHAGQKLTKKEREALAEYRQEVEV